MGMVVRSNIMALNAQRQLGMNNSQVSKSLEKLSSGFKINRAGDDASGLAISEKMKAQIKGLETASANSQDGISLIQTAEGALTEVHDMLNRMVELAEKSANGTMENPVDENGNPIEGSYGNAGTDRNAIQDEMDALATEIDRIAKSTNFNGIKLLDGSLGGISVKKTVGEPKEAVAPSQVQVSDVKLGDSNTAASFTITPKYEAGTKMSIGGVHFQFSGAYEASAAAMFPGAGTEADPFKVNLESFKTGGTVDTKGLSSAIAETINEAGGAKVGKNTFMAKADAKGNITLIAAEKKPDGTLTEKTGNIGVSKEDFEKEISGSIKVEQVKDEEVFEGATQVTVIPGAATAGVTANEGKAESQKITFGGEFAAGDTVTINGTEYTFVANKTPEIAANQIELGSSDGDGVKANTLTNIAAKIVGDGSVWKAVGESGSSVDASNNSITLVGAKVGDVAELEILYTLKGANAVAGTSTAGKNEVSATNTTMSYDFKTLLGEGTNFAAGDTVKIGDHTYTFGEGGDQVEVGEDLETTINNLAAKVAETDSTWVKIDGAKEADGSTAHGAAAGKLVLQAKTPGAGVEVEANASVKLTSSEDSAEVPNAGEKGKDGEAEVKAQVEFDFGKLLNGKKFAAGDTVKIHETTYTFSTESSGGNNIQINANATLDEQLTALKQKLGAVENVDVTVSGGKFIMKSTQTGTTGDSDLSNYQNFEIKTAGTVSATVTEVTKGEAKVDGVKGSYEITLNDLDKIKNGDKLTIGGKTFVLQTDSANAPTADAAKGETVVDLSLGALDSSSISAAVLKAAGQETDADGNVTKQANFGDDYDATLTSDPITGKLSIKIESKTEDKNFTEAKLRQALGYAAVGTKPAEAQSMNSGIAVAYDAGFGVPATQDAVPAADGDESTPSVTNKVFETTITPDNENALVNTDKIKIDFIDKSGQSKSIILNVSGDEKLTSISAENANKPDMIAKALQAVIDDNSGSSEVAAFKEAFKTVTANANGKLTFTGADGAEKVSVTGIAFTNSADTKKGDWSASTPEDVTPKTDDPSTEKSSHAGKAEVTFKTNPKEGMTVTFGKGENAVTFEFVKTKTDAPKTKNALAVVIGSDISETLKNLQAGVEGAKDADTDQALFGKDGMLKLDVSFTDNGFTVTNLDKKDPSEAPEVSTKGGGLTLQIGDTYEDFNLMNVAVNHMNMDSLFGDTDAFESMIKLDDGTLSLNVSTQEEAGKSLNAIKTAINTVSTQRAKLGALQNRLEHTINNLDVAAENMSAANSRIRDTDMAKQMMEYTKMNVLTQAAQAMLAQANQQPQSVLQLLQ